MGIGEYQAPLPIIVSLYAFVLLLRILCCLSVLLLSIHTWLKTLCYSEKPTSKAKGIRDIMTWPIKQNGRQQSDPAARSLGSSYRSQQTIVGIAEESIARDLDDLEDTEGFKTRMSRTHSVGRLPKAALGSPSIL
jgi:hypothetical protein